MANLGKLIIILIIIRIIFVQGAARDKAREEAFERDDASAVIQEQYKTTKMLEDHVRQLEDQQNREEMNREMNRRR